MGVRATVGMLCSVGGAAIYDYGGCVAPNAWSLL